MIDLVVQVLLYISAIFTLVGSIGMLRFPDFYTRVHAATLITVGGVCMGLFALFVLTLWSLYSLKILLIIIFILLTNPASTHAIARSAYKMGIKPKGLVKGK